jgi:hypothetical protein
MVYKRKRDIMRQTIYYRLGQWLIAEDVAGISTNVYCKQWGGGGRGCQKASCRRKNSVECVSGVCHTKTTLTKQRSLANYRAERYYILAQKEGLQRW